METESYHVCHQTTYNDHTGLVKIPLCVCAESFQSYLTPCDPVDYSMPGSSVHGIFQHWKWVTISFSRGSS